MSTLYVERKGGAIVGAFTIAQPGFAEEAIDSSAAEVHAFLDPPPTPAQTLATKLAAGITITSTATPALDGTYAIDAVAQQTISGIYAGIKGGDGLPGGGASFNYPDAAGAMHAFTATDFTDFSKAVRDYVYAISQGGSPTSPVTIA